MDMNKATRIFVVTVLAIVFVFSSISAAFAISTADAKEKIDPAKKASLTLTYAAEGKKLEGLEIEAFLAASVTADFHYSMTGAFADYPIEVNAIKTQDEWNEVRDTVGAYIAADKIAPTAKKTTDAQGVVKFEDLAVGIYYVRWTGNVTADQVSGFAPFLIAVPGLGEDGLWIYDVDALPKPGSLPEPESEEITLVKLWRDENKTANRPSAVSVDIYRNGELFQNIQLNAGNNWAYTWETNGSYTWTAVERNVPAGYTVAVQNTDGSTIQITNTLTEDPEHTGDSSDWQLWLVLTAVSGIALILLGLSRKKSHED